MKIEKESREKFMKAVNNLACKPVITICRQGGRKKQAAAFEVSYCRRISSALNCFDDSESRKFLSKDKIYMSVAFYFRQENYLRANILLLRLNFIDEKNEIMEYYKKFIRKFLKIIRGKPWKVRVIMVKIGKE